jgi:two-component system sensor histidine kinase PilS (NtrC family)
LTEAKQKQITDINTWKPLWFFNIYRVIISALLLLLFLTGTGEHILGQHHGLLFGATTVFYFSIAFLASYVIDKRWLLYNQLVYGLVILDIVVITLLTYASGGVTSGLGMLVIIAVAGGSVLMGGRMALLIASVAALAIILEEIYLHLYEPLLNPRYLHAGILGAIMVTSSVIISRLARQIRESEQLAQQIGLDLANMEQLNEYIIHHMQTGIVVIDDRNRIRMFNESARRLLAIPGNPHDRHLKQFSPVLLEKLNKWKQDPQATIEPFRNTATSANIQPRFARLGNEGSSGALIFIEDTASVSQQVQQMKLASLGRLTASIAHEIRNPLSAISHAGQLLDEIHYQDTGDKRLTRIIMDNVGRMDKIIENVLNLSRRDVSSPQLFSIGQWLQQFKAEFVRTNELSDDDIRINMEPETIEVRMDQHQLHQIMWNLCQNALRYTQAAPEHSMIDINVHLSDSGLPMLDIRDYGQGITAEDQQHIFEPFFTTENKSTGLGLFLARELCESNQARLDFVEPEGHGACFRITFPDPRRKQVA